MTQVQGTAHQSKLKRRLDSMNDGKNLVTDPLLAATDALLTHQTIYQQTHGLQNRSKRHQPDGVPRSPSDSEIVHKARSPCHRPDVDHSMKPARNPRPLHSMHIMRGTALQIRLIERVCSSIQGFPIIIYHPLCLGNYPWAVAKKTGKRTL